MTRRVSLGVANEPPAGLSLHVKMRLMPSLSGSALSRLSDSPRMSTSSRIWSPVRMLTSVMAGFMELTFGSLTVVPPVSIRILGCATEVARTWTW